MVSKRWLAKISAAEWGVRGIAALVAAIVGMLCTGQSLAKALQRINVAAAHTLAPGDGQIASRLAKKIMGDAIDSRDVAPLAHRAISEDPTTVGAITALGLHAQLHGDLTRARRLFAYSEFLSRRDYPTQLWLIEDAVGRNDITGALLHYDIALRIANDAPNKLFPILSTALSEPSIRDNLVMRLRRYHPIWEPHFINFAAGNGSDAPAVATLFVALGRAGIAVGPDAQAMLINRLASSGQFEQAWAYYATVRRRAARQSSRDANFTAGIASPSVFDWNPVNDGNVASSIARGEQNAVLDFSAPVAVSGTMLKQAQMLPPGTYRLEGHSDAIQQSLEALPYWVLSCENGAELGRLTVPNSKERGGKFSGQFSVPPGCPVQTLSLVARPSEQPGGLSGQVDYVALTLVR